MSLLRPQVRVALRYLRLPIRPPHLRAVHVRLPRPSLLHIARFASTTPIPRLCPSCSQPLPTSLPACPSCSSISPLPPKITHHDLFGLPYEPNPFVVDLSTLKKRFREAQAACHPDAWASKSSKEQDLAHILSSRLNEAYQCLLNPLPRVEYILEQNGVPLSETEQVEDLAFMAEIMEAREIIDEATPENKAVIDELIQMNDENIRETIQTISSLVSEEKWLDVKAAAIRLRYLQGIDRAAKQWMDTHT
ncbi:unnamed protein product [Cyclocybe aegerita]|uniref:J domain-containing protein n=1 Tax=Cyclocybe aegerita TaxID=1973307 RepID=A0A8S0WM60_CYCAE|nr:unnamed protein product [Cyclocybe aegerita]